MGFVFLLFSTYFQHCFAKNTLSLHQPCMVSDLFLNLKYDLIWHLRVKCELEDELSALKG